MSMSSFTVARRQTPPPQIVYLALLSSDGEEEGARVPEHRLPGVSGGDPGYQVSIWKLFFKEIADEINPTLMCVHKS